MPKVRIPGPVWDAEGPSCQGRFLPEGMRHIKTYFPSDPRDDYWIEFEAAPVEAPVEVPSFEPPEEDEEEAPKERKKLNVEEYLSKKRRGR